MATFAMTESKRTEARSPLDLSLTLVLPVETASQQENESISISNPQNDKLPSDVLLEIFAYLFQRHSCGFLEGNHFGASSRRTTILANLSLVCKSWNFAARYMLYEHCRITSFDALKQLLRELRVEPEEQRSVIKHLSILPTLTQLATPGNNNIEATCEDNKYILEAMRICPSASFELKLSPAKLAYFIVTTGFQSSRLSGLHITGSINDIPAPLPSVVYNFPELRTLTLQRCNIMSGIPGLNSPKLRSLRLINVTWSWSDVGTPALAAQLKEITHLELINVAYTGQSSVLDTILHAMAPNLEYLSLINVGGPNYTALVEDFTFLTSLKGLCMGPYAFSESNHIATRFPMSLETLTIWELLRPKLTNQTLVGRTTNYLGLDRFLDSCKFSTPNLHTIRVRGALYLWTTFTAGLQEKCKKNDINLELSLYKFQTIEESSAMKEAREKATKSWSSIFKWKK